MDKIQEERLLVNLDALSSSDPKLEKRIRYPVDSSYISFNSSLQAVYHHHTTWLPFETHSLIIEKDMGDADNNPVLFGIGNGEYIKYLTQNRDINSITVWERDPVLLRFVLMQHDFSKYLQDGRLRIVLGVDLLENISVFQSKSIVLHPFFSQIYTHEYYALQKLAFSPTVAIALGGLFVEDISQSLQDKGYCVWPVDLGRWSLEEIEYTLATLQPLFLTSINYRNGTSEFCEKLKLPYLCWEIDPNMDWDLTVAGTTRYSHIFTYREKNITQYTAAGFINVSHLPLASNTNKRIPLNTTEISPQDTPVPIAFVGMSMVEESNKYLNYFLQLYSHYCHSSPKQIKKCQDNLESILQQQRQDWSENRIPQLYNQFFTDFSRYLRQNNVKTNPVKIICQIAASERRRHYVSMLGGLGIHVWGDKGWLEVEQHGAKYMGYAGHHRELTQIYNLASVNIDIGRLYQLDIVTMRVFDVLACGGFLIAEHNDELEKLFRIGIELESYRTPEELYEKASYYVKNEEKATRIALEGLKAVRSRHTISQRVEQILEETTIHSFSV